MPDSALTRVAAKLSEAAGAEVVLERPPEAEHGDYATNAALQLARELRRPPRELAAELVEAAEKLPEVAKAEVAGPGFVNLWVTDDFLGAAAAEIDADYGRGWAEPTEHVNVEMVSANPTGPILVSTARNGAYGDSVARLLAYAGHAVEREYYYNDAGAQMDRFRASVEAVRRGEPIPEDGYHGDYIHELAAMPDDPVPEMLRGIEATLERFRIHFDNWVLQSELEKQLEQFLPRLPTYEKEGALWVRSSDFGDEQDHVIVRAPDRGGTPTYRAADIVYLANKLDRTFERAIYVLGADHHGTRNWYAAVAQMLGYERKRVEVLLYQLVHLTRGGEQTTMSKRRGDVVLLDELMDEIGVDAARWYLVNRGPDQTIEIDVDLAAEKSQKNPVYYVQYAHARTAGVLRNAGDARVGGEAPGALAPEERELIKRLLEFPGIVREATIRRGPQALPTYAIRVADDFHRFYHEHRVLGTKSEAFRLGLVLASQHVIGRCLDLIGVDAPERM